VSTISTRHPPPAPRATAAAALVLALAGCGPRASRGSAAGPARSEGVAERPRVPADDPRDVGNACREQVAELEGWLRAIDAAGLPLSLTLDDGGARLVVRHAAPVDDAAPIVHVTAGRFAIDGLSVDLARLGRELAQLVQLRGAVLHGSPFVRSPLCHLAIDADVPWTTVVAVSRVAGDAGVGRLSFVFADPSRSPPPPLPSSIDAQIERLRDSNPARRQQAIAELFAFVYQDCPTALKVLGQLGAQAVGDLKPVVFDELPAAIEACGCAADAASVKKLHWALFGSGQPLSSVAVYLASPQVPAVTMLRAPAERAWVEAHAALAAVSGEDARQPVELAVEEAAPGKR
jgi:hypothetical protein